MRISFFGRLGELIGREVTIEPLAGLATVADLRQALALAYPAASADLLSPRVRACVNGAIGGDDQPISAGDELALLPPVSGG